MGNRKVIWGIAAGSLAIGIVPLVMAIGSVTPGTASAASTRPVASASGQAQPARARPVCPAGEFEIVVPVPTAEDTRQGDVGTLSIALSGARAGGEPAMHTCVILGDRVESVAPGEQSTVRMQAAAARVQRILVGGQSVLVHVRPGESITLHDSTKSGLGWGIDGPRLDALGATSADAYCTRGVEARAGTCRSGFLATASPEGDELCTVGSANGRVRCVRSTRVRLVRAGGTPPPEMQLAICRRSSGNIPFALQNLRRWCEFTHTPDHCGDRTATESVCGYPMLDGSFGRAYLAVGYGERWTVRFDDSGSLAAMIE